MGQSDLARRRDELMGKAGLTVLRSAVTADVPEPASAWRLVARGGARPDVVVDDEREGYLDEVDRVWRRVARAAGVIADDDRFLIHVAGRGALHLPWCEVRLGEAARLAETLVVYPGEPEFVTLSLAGDVVCGVTTEEHGIWVLTARL